MGWQHNKTTLGRDLLGGWEPQLAEILEVSMRSDRWKSSIPAPFSCVTRN